MSVLLQQLLGTRIKILIFNLSRSHELSTYLYRLPSGIANSRFVIKRSHENPGKSPEREFKKVQFVLLDADSSNDSIG